MSEAILGKTVEESGDGIYNYSCVLCHYIALVTEFLDGWSEGDGESAEMLEGVVNAFLLLQTYQICF